MPFPLGLAIGGGLSLLGGLFGNKAKNKAQSADFENQQALLDYQNALRGRKDEADEQRRVLRGSLFKGLANAYGLGNLIPSGYSGFSTTARPNVEAPRLQNGGTGQSFLGDVFGRLGALGISNYLGQQAEAVGGRPTTDAYNAGDVGWEGPQQVGDIVPLENPYTDFGAYRGSRSYGG